MEMAVSLGRQAHRSKPSPHLDGGPGACIHHPARSLQWSYRLGGITLPILQRWQLRLFDSLLPGSQSPALERPPQELGSSCSGLLAPAMGDTQVHTGAPGCLQSN